MSHTSHDSHPLNASQRSVSPPIIPRGNPGCASRSQRFSHVFLWLMSLCFLALSGCTQQVFYGSTKLLPDGRVERAIYQPADTMPDATEAPVLWDHATYAPAELTSLTPRRLSQLPVRMLDGKNPYFAGLGTFDSVESIPGHYLKTRPGPDSAKPAESRLLRQVKMIDYGFVVQYDWQETLTDTVSLPDLHKAGQELTTVIEAVGEESLATYLGADYDLSGLKRWYANTCVPCFSESVDIYYEHAMRTKSKQHGDTTDVFVKLAENARKYGLNLLTADGKLLESESSSQVVKTYFETRLRENLKRHDGKPIPEETWLGLLYDLGIKDRPKAPADDESPPNRLQKIATEILNRRYGSREGVELEFMRYLTRILGMYQSELLGNPCRFEYALEVPGFIVSTNGDLKSDQEVKWEFSGHEAYPHGYEMSCRSLLPMPKLQKKLLFNEPLQTRVDCLKFVELVSRNSEIKEAVDKVIVEGRLAPLYLLYQKVNGAGNVEQMEQLERLWRLLKLHQERTEADAMNVLGHDEA